MVYYGLLWFIIVITTWFVTNNTGGWTTFCVDEMTLSCGQTNARFGRNDLWTNWHKGEKTFNTYVIIIIINIITIVIIITIIIIINIDIIITQ